MVDTDQKNVIKITEEIINSGLNKKDLEYQKNKLFTEFDKITTNQQLIILFIIVAALGIFIFKFAFKNNQYNCENFVINVYSYVLMGILILMLTTLTIIKLYPKSNLFSLYKFSGNKVSFMFYFIIFLFIFGGLLYLLQYKFKYNILESHIVWLVLIIALGILFVPVYVSLKTNNLFMKTFLSTALVVVIITLLVIYKKDLLSKYVTENNTNIILLALLIVIIAKVIAYFILDFNFKELKDFRIIMAYIVVVIFTYLLLADTKKILEISEESCNITLDKCSFKNDDYDICENYPSYPNQSMNIFLDIINTFQQLGVIYSSGNL